MDILIDINTTKYIQVYRTKRQFSQKGGKFVFVLLCCLPFLLLFFFIGLGMRLDSEQYSC